jgi:hypothetical protein
MKDTDMLPVGYIRWIYRTDSYLGRAEGKKGVHRH